MVLFPGKEKFYTQAHHMRPDEKWNHFRQTIGQLHMKTIEKTGMHVQSYKMLVTNIVGTKYIARLKSQNDDYHRSFQIDPIPNMNPGWRCRLIGCVQESEQTIIK